MNSITVKQNDRCFPDSSPVTPSFRQSGPITELQKGDKILPRESEDISKLGRHITLSGNQRPSELVDHPFERTPVIVAIRLHLDDSPLPLQKSKQCRHRAAVA